jgi:hypothetical protein
MAVTPARDQIVDDPGVPFGVPDLSEGLPVHVAELEHAGGILAAEADFSVVLH